MADHGDLNQYIDDRLREQRPDRYAAGAEFLTRVVESIPDDFYDLGDLLARIKREDVLKREKKARKNANDLMRGYFNTGQLELHWWVTANEPLAITVREIDDAGVESTRTEYVCLRAATPEDLKAWAANEEARAQEDFEKRMAAVSGARLLADAIAASGMTQFHEWAQTVAPTDEDHTAA